MLDTVNKEVVLQMYTELHLKYYEDKDIHKCYAIGISFNIIIGYLVDILIHGFDPIANFFEAKIKEVACEKTNS